MQKKKIYILFILVCLIFGSTFLAISLGLQAGASPFFYAALRFTSAGGIMLFGMFFTGKTSFANIFPLIFRSFLLSLFLTVGTFGCMFVAQTRIDSGFMARLDAGGPIVTAFFAVLFLGKKLTSYHFTTFVMGIAGSFLISSPVAEADPLYLIIAAGSVVFYAAGNSLYPLLFRQEEDTLIISAIQSFIGGLILMIVALFTEPVRFSSAAVLPFLYLVIAGSIVGHTATLVLVREAGPVFASGWLFVSPVIATVLGFFILKEVVRFDSIMGMILSLTGVFVLNYAEQIKRKKFEYREQL